MLQLVLVNLIVVLVLQILFNIQLMNNVGYSKVIALFIMILVDVLINIVLVKNI